MTQMILATGKRACLPVRQAITFLELLIVISIIGIFVTAAAPQFKKTFDNLELENFVKDIYYLCRYLQASAISQKKIYCLNIVLQEPKQEFFATAFENQEFKRIEGRFSKIYRAPTTVSIYAINPAEKKTILFYPDGSIDKVTIVLKNRQDKKLSLVVRGASGEIKIQ